MERVTFTAADVELVGAFYPSESDVRGAVVVTGPTTSVKEQASSAYARAMSARGFHALAFDHRSFGESGGETRQLEAPLTKVADVRGAVDFLTRRFDTADIFALGVCAGAGYMARAVAEETRFKAFAGVAGFYHDAQALRTLMGVGYDKALSRAEAARTKRLSSGVVDYIPAVGLEGDVAMPMQEAFEYYGTPRGAVANYVNRFAVESRLHTLPFDAQSAAGEISIPTVLVHSEAALSPSLARAFYERLKGPKSMVWLHSVGQIDFYDDETLIGQAADIAAHCFAEVAASLSE